MTLARVAWKHSNSSHRFSPLVTLVYIVHRSLPTLIGGTGLKVGPYRAGCAFQSMPFALFLNQRPITEVTRIYHCELERLYAKRAVSSRRAGLDRHMIKIKATRYCWRIQSKARKLFKFGRIKRISSLFREGE